MTNPYPSEVASLAEATETVSLEQALKSIPSSRVIALGADAMGLDDQQAALFRDLVTSRDLVGTNRLAEIFGIQPQSVRKWRLDRREAIRRGAILGPQDFLPALEVGGSGDGAQYLLGLVLWWGIQTERLNPDGTINTERKLPGRSAGRQAPRQRAEVRDLTAEKQQVVDAYRAARRAGLDDRAAREKVTQDLGMTRRVVARRLTDAQATEAIWNDLPQRTIARAS